MALLVEDDPDAAEIGRYALDMLGWETVVAHNGEEALFALANCPPDLVLLDICLPDVDGVGVLRVVRRLASTQDVPVVVASAVHHRSSEQARMMRDLGAPDFLRKPFGLSQLRGAVEAAVTAAHARLQWNEDHSGRSTPQNPHQRRCNVLFGGRAVEVLLRVRREGCLVLRSWAEPLPEGGEVELEIADPELGRLRVLGLVEDVRAADTGAGWTSLLRPRMSYPAHAYAQLLSKLPG
ncbi:MAG: response regulator [Proteobacteria bacterium]|nr:response regulator [Pseudomonadota bacterium]